MKKLLIKAKRIIKRLPYIFGFKSVFSLRNKSIADVLKKTHEIEKERIKDEVNSQVVNMQTYHLLMEKLRYLELLEKERSRNIKQAENMVKDRSKDLKIELIRIKIWIFKVFLIILVANVVSTIFIAILNMTPPEAIFFTLILNTILGVFFFNYLELLKSVYIPKKFYGESLGEIKYKAIIEAIDEELERRNNPKKKSPLTVQFKKKKK